VSEKEAAMIRAVYRDGKIEPLDELPAGWHEGEKLLVEQQESTLNAGELDRLVSEVEEAAAKIPDDDHDKFMAAIAEHRAEAKTWMRREMGLAE